MSTTIDQKVVEMRFDNKNFEKNTAQTMSTLDKLKEKLNLTGASKGLENINTSANKINFNGLSNAVQTVHSKFSALEIMGITALANITNSAVNAGKRIASALTIEPIKTGFQEYETQINAVQTILANTESKGTTLQQVNSALDELNTYADKTIYNFTEMTRNIGTFTAAGIDLDTSVSAIQGIANLAAVSGSNSQQASTAMYQLSQALASGTVKLMDWNSVVNAGMGGQVFQDALKETARVHGVKVDQMIKKNGSFRESLKDGWITSEILTETLAKFTMAAEEGSEEWKNYKKSLMEQGYTSKQAEEILKMANTATEAATKVKTFTQLWSTLKESAQSGWTQTWEIIVGDFGEAKEFLTSISDTVGGMISKSANSRNDFLTGGLSTGWKQLMNAGIADEAGYKEHLQKVAKKNGFEFDKLIKETEKKGGTYNDALKKALSDGKIDSDMLTKAVSNLSKEMQGMSAKEREAAGYTEEHVQEIKKLEKELKDGSISMDEFVEKMMRPSGRENLIEALTNSCKGLMNIFKPIKEAFREVFPPTTSEQLYNFTVKLKELTANFEAFTKKHGPQIKSTFKGIFSVIDIGVTFLKEFASGVMKILGNFTGFTGSILDATASLGDWLTSLRDSVKESNVFGKAIDKVVGFLQKAIDKIKEFAGPGFTGLLNVLQGIWSFVTKIGSSIGKFLGESFREGDIVAGIEVLNTGLLSGILLGIKKFIGDFSGTFEGIGDVLTSFKGILESYQQDIQAKTLLKIATAVGILAASLLVLASIKPEKLNTAITAITVLFGELLGSLAIFGKLSGNISHAFRASIAITGLATALLILSAAMKIMSTMSWSELGVGLVGTVVGLLALVGAVNLLPETKVKKAASAIKKLCTALLIFSVAMKIMATMNWEELARGLVGTVVGLAALVGAINLLPKSTALRAAGVVTLATSLVILAGALKIMATMSWDDIGRSLTVMAGGLAAIVLAVNLLPKSTAIKAVGMLGLATSLVILGGALKIMATMSWDEIGRGLAVMGGALLELVIALNLMKGAIAGSAALLIAANSLVILAMSMKILGSMSWESIIKGLVTIAATFAIVGVAGALLTPLIPTLLGLAAAFAIFGAATLAIGVGLGLIAAGIAALSTALSVGATAIVAGLTAIILGIVGLIPEIIKTLGDAIVLLCDVLISCAPMIAETVLVIVDKIFAALAKYTPSIVSSLMQFLIGVLRSLRDHLPDLIVAAVEVIGAFFQGIVNALKGINPSSLLQGVLGLTLLTGLIYMLSGIAALIPGAMVGVLGLGVVIAELALVLAAIGALAQIPGLSWLIEQGGNFLQKIGTAIGQFIGGLIGGIGLGATSTLPQVGTNLSTFMTNLQPFIEGAKAIDPSALNGVKSLVGIIMSITAANILESITSWVTGESSITKFASQLPILGAGLNAFSQAIAGMDSNAVTSAATAAKAIADMTSHIPNEGGVVAWFTGENSIAKWASELPTLGVGLKMFSTAIAGMDSNAVSAAATAGKAIADMTSNIPNEGGIVAWFSGENSMVKWASQLPILGTGLKMFSTAIAGMDTNAVTSAASAANAIAEMTSHIPNEGGVTAWFSGENSIAKFGHELVVLGTGLRMFSLAITGMDTEAVSKSAAAAKAIADMTSHIPNEGGMVAWFTGDNSMSKFAMDLPTLGTGLKMFSLAIAGMDTNAVSLAAGAAKSLAEMTATIPNEGGIVAWFTGDNSVDKWASKLPVLGGGLKSFGESLNGTNVANIAMAAVASKNLAQITEIVPENTGYLESFGNNMVRFAEKVKEFVGNISSVGMDTIKNAIDKTNELVAMTKTVASTNIRSLNTFSRSLKKVAKDGVNGFVKEFSGETPTSKAKKAVEAMVDAGIDGAEDKKSSVKDKFKEVAESATDGLSSDSLIRKAKSAGKALVQGFADGISENDYIATAKAKAMANAAEQAARDALDIHSPSRVFRKIGSRVPEGFAQGITMLGSQVKGSVATMSNTAISGTKNAIARIVDAINTDIDSQPTIRPVLDLSDVESGAGSIGALFNNGPSIGVMSNLRAISSGMNTRNQNGTNDDVISAINRLGKSLGNSKGDTYNLNGLTYNDDSNIADAVRTIVRAARMERRT